MPHVSTALPELQRQTFACFETYGRDPFNQNFRKFRSKTEWIASAQSETFENIGLLFEMDHFSRLDWSDRNRPFHLTIPTHSQSQYLAIRYFHVQHGGKHLSLQLLCGDC